MNNNKIVIAALLLGACIVVGGFLAGGGLYTAPFMTNAEAGAWLVTNRFTGRTWLCSLRQPCRDLELYAKKSN